MFLDTTHYWSQAEPLPPAPQPRSRRERLLSRVLLGYAVLLMLMPISIGGFADAVHWVLALVN